MASEMELAIKLKFGTAVKWSQFLPKTCHHIGRMHDVPGYEKKHQLRDRSYPDEIGEERSKQA